MCYTLYEMVDLICTVSNDKISHDIREIVKTQKVLSIMYNECIWRGLPNIERRTGRFGKG